MKWRKFVRDQAGRAFDELKAKYVDGPEAFSLSSKYANDYEEFRHLMLKAEKCAEELASKSRSKMYTFDLEFGLRMYDYMSRNGFNHWHAADNGTWAFLSINIIPDIVYRRCGGYNEERFHKRNWRILLKDLWWYVYLTEDGAGDSFDIEKSRRMLAGNSEDIMFLLLDHVGAGFRPSVYHELVRKYAEVLDSGVKISSREDFFRSIMLQHQIRSEVIDPVLGGVDGYVGGIFKKVMPNFIKE